MDVVLVFVPKHIGNHCQGFLLGFYKQYNNSRYKSIYIIDSQVSEDYDNSRKSLLDVIGTYSRSEKNPQLITRQQDVQDVWITIRYDLNEITVENCFINKSEYPLNKCVLVSYDNKTLIKSEFIKCSRLEGSLNLGPTEVDHFGILTNSLLILENNTSGCFNFLEIVIKFLLIVFTRINKILDKTSFILKYSNVALHTKNYLLCATQMGNTYLEKKCINLKIGNYILSAVFNILAGLLVYYMINKWTNVDKMFGLLSYSTEVIYFINVSISMLVVFDYSIVVYFFRQ